MSTRVRILSRAIACSFLTLPLAAGAVVAHADTSDELRQARRRLEGLRGTIAAREAALADLQTKLNELAARIEIAASDAEQTRGEIVDTQTRIGAREREHASLVDQLNERAVEAFVEGPATNLEFLLGASTLADLSDRMQYLHVVQQRDADLANAVHNTLTNLQASRSNLTELLGRQQATLDALKEDRTELGSKFTKQQTLFDEAQSLRDEAEALVSRLNRKLQQELAPLPPSSASSGGDGIPGPLFACPVNGPHAYGDTFGQLHVHPGWTHIHQGNDIIAPYGTPIVAPFAGTAVSGSDDTAGIYVTVTGAEGFVQMMHMSSLGQLGSVEIGTVVGYVGATGNVSGPHTHFEWHPGGGGGAADPYPQLNEVC